MTGPGVVRMVEDPSVDELGFTLPAELVATFNLERLEGASFVPSFDPETGEICFRYATLQEALYGYDHEKQQPLGPKAAS